MRTPRGFEYDTHRPNAWRYRDYVIKSFNDDKPYNLFLNEQIAGDEMDGKTDDSLIATGFLRMGPRVLFREKDNPERRFDYLDEIIGTIGKGTLGLTVNCARCHNHKFDPISQKDYYALEAVALRLRRNRSAACAARPRPRRTWRRTKRSTRKIADAANTAIERIERPYRDRLELEQIKKQFPENIVRVRSAKPEAERTPGEKLLATQVLQSRQRAGRRRSMRMPDADQMRDEEGAGDADRRAGAGSGPRRCRWRRSSPTATTASRRWAKATTRSVVPKCRIPVPAAGSYPAHRARAATRCRRRIS